MAQELPATPTPVSVTNVADALCDAWLERFGSAVERYQLAVILAQSALETGFWKSCVCYNLGGVKGTPGGYADWCIFETTERLAADKARAIVGLTPGAQLKTFVPDADGMLIIELPQPFRAFTSLQDGAAFYLGELYAGFSSAWPQVLAGDVEAFVEKLAQLHYFTASPALYVSGVLARYGVIVAPWLGFPNVAAYQAARGLAADNICGEITYRSMRSELLSGGTDDAA